MFYADSDPDPSVLEMVLRDQLYIYRADFVVIKSSL